MACSFCWKLETKEKCFFNVGHGYWLVWFGYTLIYKKICKKTRSICFLGLEKKNNKHQKYAQLFWGYVIWLSMKQYFFSKPWIRKITEYPSNEITQSLIPVILSIVIREDLLLPFDIAPITYHLTFVFFAVIGVFGARSPGNERSICAVLFLYRFPRWSRRLTTAFLIITFNLSSVRWVYSDSGLISCPPLTMPVWKFVCLCFDCQLSIFLYPNVKRCERNCRENYEISLLSLSINVSIRI